MAGSVLKLSEIKRVLKKEKLNLKIHDSKLNGMEDSITFIDKCNKLKVRGKILRSFNEGEVRHWPQLNHENVAKLINVLRIRSDIYIYLTVDHEMTLKNIVHDENFVYDDRCFDRKRSYAKGIFSGLSYLHGKSLTLMNLCDDNILISSTDDRAIITNFNHLTTTRKATKSRLNIPEMYMAPEIENGDFNASKAEIWASGILMLDMFIAHMVPWAIVNYDPKEVIQIVDMMSLDLFQAANAGSIVSAADLSKFKAFLKCFLKQNPQERIEAKKASDTLFLQNGDRYKVLKDSCESFSWAEDEVCGKNYSLNHPQQVMTTCLNEAYDSSLYSMSPSVESTEILSTNVNPCVSAAKTQQATKSVQTDKREMEFEKSLSEASKSSITVGEEKNSSPSFYRFLVPTADSEVKHDFQKMPKSLETVNGKAKFVTKLCYNCYQTNSLSFIKPEKSSNNSFSLQQFSKRNYYYSNNKPSEKQSDECTDFDLHWLFNNNDFDEGKNNPNSNAKSNSVVEHDRLNTETAKNISEIFEPCQIQAETQVKHQSIPYYPTSLQIYEKCIFKPPRNSKVPALLFTPEIKLVAIKIIRLKECFYSIQTHRKVNISRDFENKQRKILKEYEVLLLNEYYRLQKMLTKNYDLKIEDIEKLMSYVSSGNQYVSLNENLNENHWNRLLQTCGKEGDISSFRSYSDGKSKDMNVITWKIQRRHSYYRAIENANNNPDKKWEMNNQLNNKESMKKWERTNFDSSNKMKPAYLTAAFESDKRTVEGHVDAETVELVKQHEDWKRNVKTADEINSNRGALPKQARHNGYGRTEMTKQPEQYKTEQMDRYLNTIEDVNYNKYTSPKHAKNKESKNEKKRQEINTKEKTDHRKKMGKKETQKLGKNKQSVDEKPDRKDKKQRDLKRHEVPRRKWFFSECLGRKSQRDIIN